jgi:hypothetical protein
MPSHGIAAASGPAGRTHGGVVLGGSSHGTGTVPGPHRSTAGFPTPNHSEEHAAQPPAKTNVSAHTMSGPQLVATLQTKKLICIDFEATCDELSKEHTELLVTRDDQEIIELPFVVLDVATGSIEHKTQTYIKPQVCVCSSHLYSLLTTARHAAARPISGASCLQVPLRAGTLFVGVGGFA